MTDTHRSNLVQRRYRIAQAATVTGSLALGTLVVERLVAYFRDDFFLFYGLGNSEVQELQQVADARVPLTLGQLVIAALALAAIIVFVTSERRRLRQSCDLTDRCSERAARRVVVERLSNGSLFDVFVLRTSGFAGLLLSIWLLQSSVERWLGGLGLGMEYASWRSLLPLASIFGVCVLAGMLVSAVSLVGLRAIHVLEYALHRILRRRRPSTARPSSGHDTIRSVRTFRELMGCDILSRPPPMAA
jgi:hypothetical protein